MVIKWILFSSDLSSFNPTDISRMKIILLFIWLEMDSVHQRPLRQHRKNPEEDKYQFYSHNHYWSHSRFGVYPFKYFLSNICMSCFIFKEKWDHVYCSIFFICLMYCEHENKCLIFQCVLLSFGKEGVRLWPLLMSSRNSSSPALTVFFFF